MKNQTTSLSEKAFKKNIKNPYLQGFGRQRTYWQHSAEPLLLKDQLQASEKVGGSFSSQPTAEFLSIHALGPLRSMYTNEQPRDITQSSIKTELVTAISRQITFFYRSHDVQCELWQRHTLSVLEFHLSAKLGSALTTVYRHNKVLMISIFSENSVKVFKVASLCYCFFFNVSPSAENCLFGECHG